MSKTGCDECGGSLIHSKTCSVPNKQKPVTGDLDAPVPNHFNQNKRGFIPR